MKILHIYNDWKWTGPSEPILNLCLGLKNSGHTVYLACLPAPTRRDRTLTSIARDKGIAPFLLKPNRFLQIFSLWQNTRTLANFLANNPVDIIHTHSAFDHHLATRVLHYISRRPKIIKTNHTGYPLAPSLRNKSLLNGATDGYITLSESLRQKDVKLFKKHNVNLEADRIWSVPGAIDPAPFAAERPPHAFSRFKYGVYEGDIVVGIIARVQRHRRFHILLWALARAVKEVPKLKLLILGRGTYYRKILVEPIRMFGLSDNVILSGYHADDYYDMFNLMDFGVYLMPGSDGSCRAVLELMAAGKPMVVARRGVLPDIVDDNQNGLVVEDRPDNLSDALVTLAKDKEKRLQFGAQARAKVLRDFAIDNQVRKIEAIYNSLINR